MLNAIKVNLSRQEIIGAVKSMKKKDRKAFLEELLATTSPEYLESIKEARLDYKAGRVKTHDEVFGHGVIGSYIPGKPSGTLADLTPLSKSASVRPSFASKIILYNMPNI